MLLPPHKLCENKSVILLADPANIPLSAERLHLPEQTFSAICRHIDLLAKNLLRADSGQLRLWNCAKCPLLALALVVSPAQVTLEVHHLAVVAFRLHHDPTLWVSEVDNDGFSAFAPGGSRGGEVLAMSPLGLEQAGSSNG